METQAIDDQDHLVNYDNDNDNDDLGYESEVYLDEDENNHSNGNVVKKGITRLSKFRREYGKPNIIKLSVTFDALNRISGSHRALFSSFLGDLIRKHIGLKILSWKKVSSKARDKLWVEIMIENKEIEPDEEPPRGIMWLKGRVNKDEQFQDDEIRSVGDKLRREREEKEIEIHNLSNKMSEIEGMVTKLMNQLDAQGEQLQSISTKLTPSDVRLFMLLTNSFSNANSADPIDSRH
ncbi:integrase, catalytic region, zinc finger, CCHC-type containing protein [Tanacetum coccineum]